MVLWWYFHLPQETLCRPENSTLLVCTAPALSGPTGNINYTIIMDNAPGPSNSGDLRLSLVANPDVGDIGLDPTDHLAGTVAPITINVRTTLYLKFDLCTVIYVMLCCV